MPGPTSATDLNRTGLRGKFADGLLAVLWGALVFAANNLNVLRAQFQTPSGMRALWSPREIDIAQHLAWVNAMRDALVIPNYHMPARTTAGFFCLFTWLLGQVTKLGIDAAQAYAAAQLLVSILSVYCVLACLRLFRIPGSRYFLVVLLALASVPPRALPNLWGALHGRGNSALFGFTDGFFIPGAFGVALGTLSVFAALALVTRYVLYGRRADLYATAAVAAFSGLCHPFEVFTIMAATSLTLLVTRWPSLRRAAAEALPVCVAGGLSLLPYAYLSLTVPWMSAMTRSNTEVLPDFLKLMLSLGLPAVFALVMLVARPKLLAPTDVVLQCWFVAVLAVLHIPKLPYATHAADGFSLIAALLAVRQTGELREVREWLLRHRRAAACGLAAMLAPALFAHAAYRYVIFHDALNPNSRFGQSAVALPAEGDLIRWFRGHGSAEDVVIVPTTATAWMLATAPVHTVASHWLFSGTFEAQQELRIRLYNGDWTPPQALEFLRRYGINYVVAPQGSRLQQLLGDHPRAAVFGPWTLYHLPENHMVDHLPDPEWSPFEPRSRTGAPL